MLRLSRREGESVALELGKDDQGVPMSGTVTVLEVEGKRVLLGFNIPGFLGVVRTELLLVPRGTREREDRR